MAEYTLAELQGLYGKKTFAKAARLKNQGSNVIIDLDLLKDQSGEMAQRLMDSGYKVRLPAYPDENRNEKWKAIGGLIRDEPLERVSPPVMQSPRDFITPEQRGQMIAMKQLPMEMEPTHGPAVEYVQPSVAPQSFPQINVQPQAITVPQDIYANVPDMNRRVEELQPQLAAAQTTQKQPLPADFTLLQRLTPGLDPAKVDEAAQYARKIERDSPRPTIPWGKAFATAASYWNSALNLADTQGWKELADGIKEMQLPTVREYVAKGIRPNFSQVAGPLLNKVNAAINLSFGKGIITLGLADDLLETVMSGTPTWGGTPGRGQARFRPIEFYMEAAGTPVRTFAKGVGADDYTADQLSGLSGLVVAGAVMRGGSKGLNYALSKIGEAKLRARADGTGRIDLSDVPPDTVALARKLLGKQPGDTVPVDVLVEALEQRRKEMEGAGKELDQQAKEKQNEIQSKLDRDAEIAKATIEGEKKLKEEEAKGAKTVRSDTGQAGKEDAAQASKEARGDDLQRQAQEQPGWTAQRPAAVPPPAAEPGAGEAVKPPVAAAEEAVSPAPAPAAKAAEGMTAEEIRNSYPSIPDSFVDRIERANLSESAFGQQRGSSVQGSNDRTLIHEIGHLNELELAPDEIAEKEWKEIHSEELPRGGGKSVFEHPNHPGDPMWMWEDLLESFGIVHKALSDISLTKAEAYFIKTHPKTVDYILRRLTKSASAESIDKYNIELPDGYIKEGDRYVYKPEAPPAAGAKGEAAAKDTSVYQRMPLKEVEKQAKLGVTAAKDELIRRKGDTTLLRSGGPSAEEIVGAGKKAYERVTGNIPSKINATDTPDAAYIMGRINKGTKQRGSFVDWWRRQYTLHVDKLDPIKQFERNLKQQGVEIPEISAYEAARLLRGWQGKAGYFMERSTFDPVTMRDTGPALRKIIADLEDPDQLRVLMVGRRVIEKEGQGIKTGFDVERVQRGLDQIPDRAKYEPIADMLDTYQDQLLQYALKRGMISEEQYTRIKAMNEYYIPFYRFFEEQKPAQGGGLTTTNVRQAIKRMKGGDQAIIDPLESIIKNTYAIINGAERNRVAQIVADYAGKDAAEGLVRKIKAPVIPAEFELKEVKKYLEEAGFDVEDADLDVMATIFRPQRNFRKDNVISAIIDGKRSYYEVQPELYRAMERLDNESVGMLMKVLSIPTKTLRLGATVFSPEFVIGRNPFRDAMDAFMQSQGHFIPGVDSFKGLLHLLKHDEVWAEYQKGGAGHSGITSWDRADMQKAVKDMLAGKYWLARHPVEAAHMFSEATEAMTRLGEFGKLRQKGVGIEKAALAGRNVSLDFARSGSVGKAINMIDAFYAAGINGLDRFVTTHRDYPTRTAIRGLIGLTLPTVLLRGLIATNEEDEKEYLEINRVMRDIFWYIPTRGTPLYQHTHFLRLPKPFLYGLVYASIPERIVDWISKKDPNAMREFGSSVLSGALPSLIPQIASVPIEYWGNKSIFMDKPVVPGYLQNVPEKYQWDYRTSESSKQIANLFSKIGVPISPMKLDNAIYGVTGNAGRNAVDFLNPLIGDPYERPAYKWSDVPVLRAFMLRNPNTNTESFSGFFDRLDELTKKKSLMSSSRKYGRDVEEGDRITPDEIRELKSLTKANEEIRKINAKIRTVLYRRDLDAQLKREMIDELTIKMMQTASKGQTKTTGEESETYTMQDFLRDNPLPGAQQ